MPISLDGWPAFLLWVTSLVVAGAWIRRAGAADAPPLLPERRDWLAVVFVFGVSAFLRVYRIEHIPYGLWIDESWTAHNAARLGALPAFRPFGATPLIGDQPHWVQTSNLYLYACWILEWMFGFSRFGVKMISVVPALFAPPLLFVLGRQFFKLWPSLLASFLFAVSTWHLTLSRWGWDELFLTTAIIGVFLLLERGFQRNDRLLHFLAGALLGVTLYTYVGARLAVVAVGAFLAVTLAQLRSRDALAAAGSVGLGFVLASVPLIMFWLAHPVYFSVRSGSVSIMSLIENGDIPRLKLHAMLYLKMFHVRGDFEPRQNYPLDPQLDPLTGVAFVVGMALCLWSWRERRSHMLGLWFVAILAGGFLSTPAPHAYRTGALAPACFLFAAQAFETVFDAIRARWPRRMGWTLVAAGVIALGIAGRNVHRYFVTRVESQVCWESMWKGGPALLIVERFEALRRTSRDIHFDAQLRGIEVESELRLAFGSFGARDTDAYLARVRPATGDFWVDADAAERIHAVAPLAIFVLNLDQRDAYAARMPNLRFEPIQDPFGVPRALLASDRTLASVGVAQ